MSSAEPPRWASYARLRPDQIEAIRASTPVAYVPWGALEWHSYHAPVGLDGIVAEGLAEALAARTGGVVLPPFYVGTDTIKPFKGFPHTLEHAASTVEMLATEVLRELAREQFGVVVLITGHLGGAHMGALERATASAREALPQTRFLFFGSFQPIEDTFPPNHAAHGETSLQLAVEPEPVDLARVPSPAPTLDDDGVWGADPSTASAEVGEAIRALFVERVAPQVEAALEAV